MTDLKFDQHFSRSFNAELADVRTRVLHMGGHVDSQIERAVNALLHHDVAAAESVISDDHKINAMEVEIDEECTRIIALRAPAASDLRLVITVIKTITDLERMGDEAERVAKMVQNPDSGGISPVTLGELEHMGELVRAMLSKALDAFNRNDATLALETSQKDAAVDRKYQSLIRQLTTFMAEDNRNIGACLAALWAARALERIGDRSRNICEYVIYLVGGKDVRHTSLDDMQAAVKAAEEH